jgi:hypothetical protein
MKNTTISLTALALACCCAAPAFAQYGSSRPQYGSSRPQDNSSRPQYDSSRLDAGYLHLKRDFTQTITIKGTDLERMPFTNLNEAIAAWFYGAYTQPVTLQYVVDGNPVSDVNAYSIHDIEEVVLVQNAAALVNTANGQQELVIVRTKRGQGKSGITADAETGLVANNAFGHVSNLKFYHDYYLNAWQNLDKVSFGASGNYIRDVYPDYYSQDEVTPDHLQRWRLNGYFAWRPNNHNQVEIMLNYTPERMGYLSEDKPLPSVYTSTANTIQHYFLPHLLWHSDLSSKWTNDLQATYVHSTARASTYNTGTEETPTDTLQQSYNRESGLGKAYHLWLRDHIEYRMTAGHWHIEPAINATYEHYDEQTAGQSLESIAIYNGNTLGPVSTVYLNSETYRLKESMVVLTPAFDISYKRAFNIQGGVLVDAGHQKGSGGRDAFPFASVSLDLFRLADEHASSGLKVFGSYAQRTMPSPQGYSLLDLKSGTFAGGTDYETGTAYEGTLTGVVPVVIAPNNVTPVYWVWQTGLSYTGWKDRLTIQYSFERRNFLEPDVAYPPGGNPVPIYPEFFSTLQHADVRVKVFDAEGWRWLTGANLTLLSNKLRSGGTTLPTEQYKQDVGDDSPNPHSWTGGWVNRVQVKRFTAGFDLLYHFGESVQSETYSGTNDTVKVNSVITPNIYIGYSWHLPGAQTLECFVESRGLIRNSTSDLLDDRQYYTVGGKLSL